MSTSKYTGFDHSPYIVDFAVKNPWTNFRPQWRAIAGDRRTYGRTQKQEGSYVQIWGILQMDKDGQGDLMLV